MQFHQYAIRLGKQRREWLVHFIMLPGNPLGRTAVALSVLGCEGPAWLAQFTNVGKDFKGTLDYILYTTDSLAPVAMLELPDDAEVAARAFHTPCLCHSRWDLQYSLSLSLELETAGHAARLPSIVLRRSATSPVCWVYRV